MAVDVPSLLRQLLLIYDPSLDVTSGSRLDTTVITPLAGRLEPQLTETSAAAFLRTRLTEAFPELDGYGFEDTNFQPAQVLTTSVRRELARLEAIFSSPRFENLTIEEARLRAAQFFVYGADGTRTQVVVRVYFATLRDRAIPLDATFYGSNNLRYYPVSPRTYLSEEQEQDSETGEYYVDVLCYAEQTGQVYNVEPGMIRAVTGVPGASRCNNLARQATDGVDTDTQSVLYQKVLNTAERSLTKVGGISQYVTETFPGLYDRVRVVKAGDEEMVRDRLEVIAEILGGPITYLGQTVTTLSGTGDAVPLSLSPPALVPDVTNLFDVPSVFGMSVGDVITIENADLPILSIDDTAQRLHLDSIDPISFGSGLFIDTYPVPGGAYLLRSDILGASSTLIGQTGDKLYAQDWPKTGSGPTTYDVVSSGGLLRAAPSGGSVISILLKGISPAPYVVNPRYQVFDIGGTAYGIPVSDISLPAGVSDRLITVRSLGAASGDPIETYEFEIDGTGYDAVNGFYYVEVSRATPGVPNIIGHWFDFTVHSEDGFALDSNNRFVDPDIENNSLWMIYRVKYGELEYDAADTARDYQYREAASISDLRFRLNGYTYDDYIKIGGMTDVYLRDRGTGEEAATLDPIPDNDPVYRGKCEFIGNSGNFSFFLLYYQNGVQRGDLLYLLSGCDDEDIGGHRIVEVYVDSQYTYVRVPIIVTASPVPSTTPMTCQVSHEIVIDAFSPEELHAEGTDLATQLQSDTAITGVDLSAVEPGVDLLRINSGPDEGEYQINAVSPPYIRVDGVFSTHTNNLPFEIFSPSGTLLRKPLVRVTEMTRDDYRIPYAYPSIAYLTRSVQSKRIVPNAQYAANDAELTTGSDTIEFTYLHPNEVGVAVGDYISIEGDWHRIVAVGSKSVQTETTFGVDKIEQDYSIGRPGRSVLRLLFTEAVATWLPENQRFSYGSAEFRVPPDYEEYVTSAAGVASAGEFTSETIDLVDTGVAVGDKVYAKTKTLLSADLTTIAPLLSTDVNLSGTTLSMSVAGTSYNIFFTGTNPLPLTQVSPPGIVEQIRRAVPSLSVWANGNYLAIGSDNEVELDLTSSAAVALGFTDSTNLLVVPASYTVQDVFSEYVLGGSLTHKADTGTVWDTSGDIVNVEFHRVGNAFITASQRPDQLFQTDVEIESIGFGDAFNLDGGTVLETALPIEGFRFEDVDEGLSFSTRETGNLVIRAVIPSSGGYALMDQAVVRFRYGPNVAALQSHLDDDSVRHLGNDLLVKVNHEAPTHRSLDVGGTTSPDVIVRGGRNYIRDLGPGDQVEILDFHRALINSGARDLTNPTPLFIYYEDALRRRQGVVVVDEFTPPRSVMPFVGFIG